MNPPTVVLPGFSDYHSPVTCRTYSNQIYSLPTDRTTEVDWGDVVNADASAGYVDRVGLECGDAQPQPVSPQNTKGGEDHGREVNLLST